MAKIVVLAGVNGAGKSSVAGAALRENGGDYFNPDEASRAYLREHPEATLSEANGTAWKYGFEALQGAIRDTNPGRVFNFETTLGGSSICTALLEACAKGHEVHVWFVGLATPELHIARVAARVAQGGHDIPEAKIRERYPRALENVIRLMPVAASIQVFDNSLHHAGRAQPERLLFVLGGRMVASAPSLNERTRWAAPLLGAAMQLGG